MRKNGIEKFGIESIESVAYVTTKYLREREQYHISEVPHRQRLNMSKATTNIVYSATAPSEYAAKYREMNRIHQRSYDKQLYRYRCSWGGNVKTQDPSFATNCNLLMIDPDLFAE